MTKTLGQVAYEGWDSDVMTHTPWDEIAPGFQAAWQAAAEAVAKHIQKGFILNSPEERAVIEAAKDWRKHLDEGALCRCWDEELYSAVEALQEVE